MVFHHSAKTHSLGSLFWQERWQNLVFYQISWTWRFKQNFKNVKRPFCSGTGQVLAKFMQSVQFINYSMQLNRKIKSITQHQELCGLISYKPLFHRTNRQFHCHQKRITKIRPTYSQLDSLKAL